MKDVSDSNTETKILEAAEKLFKEKGYALTLPWRLPGKQGVTRHWFITISGRKRSYLQKCLRKSLT